MEEYIKVFDLKDIQKTAPIFDPVKLEWLNGEYIRKYQISNIKYKILDYFKIYKNKKLDENLVERTTPLIKERIKKLSDYWDYCQFFFEEPKEYDIDLKSKKELLENIYKELEKINDWKVNIIGESMINLAKKFNIKTGDFFMILRIAITGKKVTPPLNESMEILGKNECLRRIKKLI